MKENKYKLYGEFHIGDHYDINDWMTMPSASKYNITIAVFKCKQFVSNDQPLKHLYIVISESAFLALLPDENHKNICILSVYASLYALESIERDLDIPNKIIFYWDAKKTKV